MSAQENEEPDIEDILENIGQAKNYYEAFTDRLNEVENNNIPDEVLHTISLEHICDIRLTAIRPLEEEIRANRKITMLFIYSATKLWDYCIVDVEEIKDKIKFEDLMTFLNFDIPLVFQTLMNNPEEPYKFSPYQQAKLVFYEKFRHPIFNCFKKTLKLEEAGWQLEKWMGTFEKEESEIEDEENDVKQKELVAEIKPLIYSEDHSEPLCCKLISLKQPRQINFYLGNFNNLAIIVYNLAMKEWDNLDRCDNPAEKLNTIEGYFRIYHRLQQKIEELIPYLKYCDDDKEKQLSDVKRELFKVNTWFINVAYERFSRLENKDYFDKIIELLSLLPGKETDIRISAEELIKHQSEHTDYYAGMFVALAKYAQDNFQHKDHLNSLRDCALKFLNSKSLTLSIEESQKLLSELPESSQSSVDTNQTDRETNWGSQVTFLSIPGKSNKVSRHRYVREEEGLESETSVDAHIS